MQTTTAAFRRYAEVMNVDNNDHHSRTFRYCQLTRILIGVGTAASCQWGEVSQLSYTRAVTMVERGTENYADAPFSRSPLVIRLLD